MTLKKTAKDKQTSLPRAADYTKEFIKDWDRLSKSGRYNMKKLKEAMLLLILNEISLGVEWKDHQLIGEWQGHRECHIGGDFLLIYKLQDSKQCGLVIFVRAGTHAELFD